MGILGFREKSQLSNTDLFSTLNYVPAVFSPHEEKEGWKTLKQMVEQTQGTLPAIGIPSGAGLKIGADNFVQAIHKPATIVGMKENKLIEQNAWKIQL